MVPMPRPPLPSPACRTCSSPATRTGCTATSSRCWPAPAAAPAAEEACPPTFPALRREGGRRVAIPQEPARIRRPDPASAEDAVHDLALAAAVGADHVDVALIRRHAGLVRPRHREQD